MGCLGSCARLLCLRFLPLLLLGSVVWMGYLHTEGNLDFELPLGALFATIFKVKALATQDFRVTADVPADLKPEPVPAGMVYYPLPSGAQMPAAGLGMCCRPLAYHHPSAKNQVLWYLMQGGRLIDTAEIYLNHKPVGEAIKEAVARGIPREEIFVTTKIFPPNFGFEPTKKAFAKALSNLDLDYVDLVLLHGPQAFTSFTPEGWAAGLACETPGNCYAETWNALKEAQTRGEIKDIGVSNFNEDHVKALTATGVLADSPIATNQLPYNPFVPEEASAQVKYSQEQGIRITGYATLGGDLDKSSTLVAEAVEQIAAKHKQTTAQVLLRWSIQKGVAVIPGTSTPKHMKENLAVFDFELTAEEVAQIDQFGAENGDLVNTPAFLVENMMRTEEAKAAAAAGKEEL